MACNFIRHWLLQCFGGQQDNPNDIGNMFDLLFRFRFRWLKQCFGEDPESQETSIQGYGGNRFSQYYWERKLACHLYGQYSMAVAQANLQIEDRSQLFSGSLTDSVNGPHGVFVGIYDGHGEATCSQFVLDNLFKNFKSAVKNHDAMNPEVIQEAYHRTEAAFVDHVRDNWLHQPRLAMMGSCCLVGVVLSNVLYVANAGDSRAVLARRPDGGELNDLEVVQLSIDYNANDPERRAELFEEHPSLDITEVHQGKWYIRKTLQPTRAIGDVYIKHNEFNRTPLPAQYIHGEPIIRPIVKAEPMIQTRTLGPNDKFVIFASDGLWDEMDNSEAADFVRNNPRDGAAARLLRKALEKAAGRCHREYNDLRYFKPGTRRQFHDDISIVIVFLDNLEAPPPPLPSPPSPPPLSPQTPATAQADLPLPVENLETQIPLPPQTPEIAQADPPLPLENLGTQTPPQADTQLPVDKLEAQDPPPPAE